MLGSKFKLLLILLLISLPFLSQGREGLVFDPNELNAIQKWQPEPMGYAGPPSVDLRYNSEGKAMFPVAGRQMMNDCTAWATAYHLKSYLEAVDHGWSPDHPSRQFSPSFLYNQINSGKDQGSSVVRALQLMKQSGAARLSAMPYTRNYRTKPNRTAFNDAKQYKIKSYYKLDSLGDIKLALQQGNPVLVGITTDDIFNSGKYDIFTKNMRLKSTRSPGMRHGRHAMVIVGYDNIRQALLFMNSWGSHWGKNGYCWVSYDLFSRIGYQDDYSNFLEVALVAIDEKTGGKPVVRQDEPGANGRAWFAGLRNNRGSWHWKVYLTGSSAAINNVKKVNWRLPRDFKMGRGRTGTRSNNFELNGFTEQAGLKRIEAHITYNNGKKSVKAFNLNIKKNIRRGALSFYQTDRYYGRIKGKPYWEWSLMIRGSLSDLQDIQQVTYHLHPTFPRPNVVVRGGSSSGFRYSTRGWGTFAVGATVLFKDGTKRKFRINLNFRSPINDNLRLTNVSRPFKVIGGRLYYSWTAFIQGPKQSLDQVKGVRYFLHSTFPSPVRDVTIGRNWGFPMSATGWGTFQLKAQVFLKNGRSVTLKHNLTFSD